MFAGQHVAPAAGQRDHLGVAGILGADTGHFAHHSGPDLHPGADSGQSKKPQRPGAGRVLHLLEQTQGQHQQQIEDPAAFVGLVEGAVAVAPGAIAEDAALYAESVRALATMVTGTPKQAAKADAWLTQNEDAIAAAEANLDSYSQSTCGLPFITGEG